MSAADPRAALDALIREHREDYAALSRLIGRNPAYIQQYVKRGTPRRLAEQDRRALARYFGVAEAVLGGSEEAAPRVMAAGEVGARTADLVAVPRYDLGASAGPGALAEQAPRRADMIFPPALLRSLGVGSFAALSLIRVAGDSMEPTLADGDDLLVDGEDGVERLRDGLYVLRADDVLLVKRLAIGPGGAIEVISDNPLRPRWTVEHRDGLAIVGRVIWAGRRLR